MSKTPRTDELIAGFPQESGIRELSNSYNTLLGHARQLETELATQAARIEDWDGFIERINQWAKAYPTDIFPEITKEQWKQIADMLDSSGLPALDRISASNMRHVVTNIKREMDAALPATPKKEQP